MKSDAEKRRESRLPLVGFQVEISRDKWGRGSPQLCRLVDLSSNGLSFVSHDNRLAPLDKIGFRLHVGEGHAEGKGVICYRQPESDSRWRYGAMFLTISPEVETLLKEESLEMEEVRAVARELADRMATERCGSADQRRLLRSRLLLYDAVQSFLERLEVMNYPLAQPLDVDLEEGLRIGQETPLTIATVENGLGYVSNRGKHFANVFEVLEFLRDQLTVNQTAR